MQVNLTKDQIALLLSCIRIAHEDGSVYGGAFEAADRRKIDAKIERLQDVLREAQR